METIKILMYEDNEELKNVIIEGLKNFEKFQLLATFQNCINVVEDIKKYKPDVVIMDIDLPHISGVDAVKTIKKINSNIEIIMHTVFEDEEKIFEAIRNGATGYLIKSSGLKKLIQGIDEVLQGGAPMSPSIARKVLKFHSQKSTNKEILSEREREIIQNLSEGLSYKMVSEKLFISIDTVRTHCKKIYKKLQVHTLAEALHKLK
jgi:DNA-binding NarL/FixJ family response regulator